MPDAGAHNALLVYNGVAASKSHFGIVVEVLEYKAEDHEF